jgi:hypothetical protein
MIKQIGDRWDSEKLARACLLPHEVGGKFETFSTALTAAFDPQDAIELFFVERAIWLSWRLRRVLKIETSLFRWHRDRLYLIDEQNFRANPNGVQRPKHIQLYPRY